MRRRDYLCPDPSPAAELPEGLFLEVAAPLEHPWEELRQWSGRRAQRSLGFPRPVRAGGGSRRSPLPRQRPPGGRLEGRSGPAGERGRVRVPPTEGSLRRPAAASPTSPGAGWSLQGRKFPGTAACVTAGLGPRGGRRRRRRRPRGRALGGAGCRWPGCARGGAGGGSVRGRGGGGEEGCGAGAVAASRRGAREQDEEEGAAVAAAAVLRAPLAPSSGPADDPAAAGRR